MAPGPVRDAWLIDRRSSAEVPHLLLGAALKCCAAGGAKMVPRSDRVYGVAVMHRLRAMGIRDKPIAPGSPWQNGFAERLIGSIRRECVDHVVVLGEAHLRRILTKYAAYYNELRTHRSLNKDAPIHCAIQHVGRIISAPVRGGLHRHYCRI